MVSQEESDGTGKGGHNLVLGSFWKTTPERKDWAQREIPGRLQGRLESRIQELGGFCIQQNQTYSFWEVNWSRNGAWWDVPQECGGGGLNAGAAPSESSSKATPLWRVGTTPPRPRPETAFVRGSDGSCGCWGVGTHWTSVRLAEPSSTLGNGLRPEKFWTFQQHKTDSRVVEIGCVSPRVILGT